MQNSGHLRLCQQPRAAHALRSDQFNSISAFILPQSENISAANGRNFLHVCDRVSFLPEGVGKISNGINVGLSSVPHAPTLNQGPPSVPADILIYLISC
jgi:hypothetical protein